MSACRVVNAVFGAAFLLVSVLVEPVTEAASAAAACSRDCQIPSCYCDQSAIPGGLNPVDTPQMVLFAFNDPVTSATRKKIIDVFPDKLRNPITDCPIAITLFVVGTGSDYCAIHRLYVRGHEIATGGFNRTGNTEGWTPLDWERQLADHQTRLVEEAYLPEDHVRGARAPLQKPGGDNQYSVLYEKGFRYDATLLGGTGSLDPHGQPPWPVTLDTLWPNCLTPKCPKNSYPGLWELPITRLANPVNGRPCAYLDACLVSLKTSTDVYKLLYQNFRYNYDSNRAPMIINIQTKTLRSATAVGGIKKFLNKLLSDAHDDTWILTMQDALDWIQSPTPISELGSSDTWSCPDRNFHACNMDGDDEESRRKAKNMESPFRSLIFVDSLWIYQIVFLVFAYLVLLRHDSRQNK